MAASKVDGFSVSAENVPPALVLLVADRPLRSALEETVGWTQEAPMLSETGVPAVQRMLL